MQPLPLPVDWPPSEGIPRFETQTGRKGGAIHGLFAFRHHLQQLDAAVSRIEQVLLNSYDREVTSVYIGDLAMEQLKKMDDVAYVRFASVYRQFSDVNTFMDELKDMLDSLAKNGGMQG